MRAERHYDRQVAVDGSGIDCALELTLRSDDGQRPGRVVRIPVEDIPEFLSAVVQHGTKALSVAARRLEVGHCETCGNTGLHRIEKLSVESCPDCWGRWPSKPFANTPKGGGRASLTSPNNP